MANFFPPIIGLGDRKLKIQKNGVDVATFSANEQNYYDGQDDVPIIANIEVPTSDTITNTTGQFNTTTGGKLESCVINIEPKQSGSGTPSPSNVRPITGHTAVEVWGHGKNCLPMTVDNIKSANTSGTWSGNVYTLNGVDFTVNTDNDGKITSIKANGTASSNANFRLTANENHNFDNMVLSGCPSGGSSTTYYVFMQSGTTNVGRDTGEGFEIPTGYEDIATYLGISIRSGYNAQNVFFYPMLRLATDTDATFAPYQGQDIIVNLGGTYYGGTLDVVSGKLTVDRAYAEFDGSDDENWTRYTGGANVLFYINLSNVKINTSNIICNRLAYASVTSSSSDIGVYIANQNLNLRYVLDNTLTVSDLRTWLSSNPLQVCYELATPIVIQLTPQQIETLIGQNNISVPLTGQSLDSLTYRELFAWDDVEKAIESKADKSSIGTEETGVTASKAYSVGEHFLKDGKFCTAIASISSGATLTLNTNYVEGNIADAVRYEEGSITPSTGIIMSYNQVRRFGKVVNVWIAMGTPSNMSSDVILGTIDFIPSTTFGFLNVTRADRPYENVGTVFIRNNKQVVLPSGIPASTNIYIFGTYICQ